MEISKEVVEILSEIAHLAINIPKTGRENCDNIRRAFELGRKYKTSLCEEKECLYFKKKKVKEVNHERHNG